jgi:hypothetical protein
MRATTIGTRLLVAVAASLLLAGCGGGDDDSRKPAKVDRTGYFSKEQSETLNPALAVYDTAFRALDTGHDACSAASTRLFDAGKDARVAVKCHLDQTGAVVEALDDLDAAFDEVDPSDFRAACAKQFASSTKFVDTYRVSWKAVLDDWERYADGKEVSTPLVQKHFNDAYAKSQKFSDAVVVALSNDCYTKADLAAAAKAADAAAAKDADSKDDAKDDAKDDSKDADA